MVAIGDILQVSRADGLVVDVRVFHPKGGETVVDSCPPVILSKLQVDRFHVEDFNMVPVYNWLSEFKSLL